MTCGIGADSLEFAQTGLPVTAVELDPATAEIAKWNLKDYPNVRVICSDGLAVAREVAGHFGGLFADPARRERANHGKREQIFDPDQYLPPLGQVLDLTAVVPALGVKIAPVIPHEALPTGAEAQWVSVDGDVVECCLWFGPLATRGVARSALLLRSASGGAEARERLVVGAGDGEMPAEQPFGQVGEYLFEPDGAIIRAGLLATAAAELHAHQLDTSIAYLTGNQPPPKADLPLATAYRVIDVMPFNVKQLKSNLQARHVGRVTIKKRGTAVTPEQLRPQLALKGKKEATLVLTRIAGKHSVLIVDPV
jgi:hypothetical protein